MPPILPIGWASLKSITQKGVMARNELHGKSFLGDKAEKRGGVGKSAFQLLTQQALAEGRGATHFPTYLGLKRGLCFSLRGFCFGRNALPYLPGIETRYDRIRRSFFRLAQRTSLLGQEETTSQFGCPSTGLSPSGDRPTLGISRKAASAFSCGC